jgi:hypothetical protein
MTTTLWRKQAADAVENFIKEAYSPGALKSKRRYPDPLEIGENFTGRIFSSRISAIIYFDSTMRFAHTEKIENQNISVDNLINDFAKLSLTEQV